MQRGFLLGFIALFALLLLIAAGCVRGEYDDRPYDTYHNPGGDDMIGVLAWIRYGYERNAIGFLHRPLGGDPLSFPAWNALPVAAEYAWSYDRDRRFDQIWYDLIENNKEYGVLE